MVHLLPAVNIAHQTQILSYFLFSAGCVWTETFESCVICEQFKHSLQAKAVSWRRAVVASVLRSPKSLVSKDVRRLEVLNARDSTTWMPVICCTPVELWFSCLYMVFGTWLIKPGDTTFPLHNEALKKVFLVGLFLFLFFFFVIFLVCFFKNHMHFLWI